jgi:lipoate---protein ligase
VTDPVAGVLSPPHGLALDEALARAEPSDPVIAVWRCTPAVIVGRFQRPEWEIDPAACAARGVRVWRRFTGGGTVYLDPGVVCAALVVPASHPAATAGVPDMYSPFLDGIVQACRSLGVDAERDQRTVRVGGRKVTGIAAHRNRSATLVHGTLLVDADLDALQSCIAGPRSGALDGAPRPSPSRPDRVANVGGAVVAAEAAIVAGFPYAAPVVTETADAHVAALARDLLASRYDDRDWHAGPWKAVTPAAVAALLGGG